MPSLARVLMHVAALTKARVLALVRGPVNVIGAAHGVFPVQVPEYHIGVPYVDGRIERLLEPGLYAFYRFNRDLRAPSWSICACR